MKLTYAISFEDFRSLQPPFPLLPRKGAGYRGLMIVCASIALLGLFFIGEGIGLRPPDPANDGKLKLGMVFEVIAAIGAVVGYVADPLSVRRAKETYEQNILAAYGRLHCRDERMFETGDTGYAAACRCGTVTRPWSELTAFTDGLKLLILRTKTDSLVIPKSAFPSEGALTEFRSLVNEKLSSSRSVTARYIEFRYTKLDYTRGRMVHILKGGGWRRILRIAFGLVGLSYFLAAAIYLTNSHGYLSHPIATPILIVLGLYFVLVLRRRWQRKRHFGSIRIYYSAEGLQLQDATSVARISWDQFVGYLEGDQLFLLYHNPHRYRIVPKRALAEREQQFRELVQDKLPGFDYRVPFAPPARV
jgi:hypothetical protein